MTPAGLGGAATGRVEMMVVTGGGTIGEIADQLHLGTTEKGGGMNIEDRIEIVIVCGADVTGGGVTTAVRLCHVVGCC